MGLSPVYLSVLIPHAMPLSPETPQPRDPAVIPGQKRRALTPDGQIPQPRDPATIPAQKRRALTPDGQIPQPRATICLNIRMFSPFVLLVCASLLLGEWA